jgi:hypothetical protein
MLAAVLLVCVVVLSWISMLVVGVDATTTNQPPGGSSRGPPAADTNTPPPTEDPAATATLWEAYSDVLSQATSHIAVGSDLVTSLGRQAYAGLPASGTTADDIAATLASAASHAQNHATSMIESPYGKHVQDTLATTLGHGKRLASGTYHALPPKETLRRAVVQGYNRVPSADDLHTNLRTTVDSLPAAAELESAMHSGLQAGVARASEGVSAITDLIATLTQDEQAVPSKPVLECPFLDATDFNAAFDAALENVRSAQSCGALTDAMRRLHERFSHRYIDTEQVACASLSQRLDEFNGVSTKNTASLCV